MQPTVQLRVLALLKRLTRVDSVIYSNWWPSCSPGKYVLQAASQGGHDAVVNLLLENGAE
ncbi:hypothetical protein BDZ97DRAFT_1772240 [Flammula alnicola]|nr:hypothetical protein BDZ97DRAFT_1772240 [Flammula alnicola]